MTADEPVRRERLAARGLDGQEIEDRLQVKAHDTLRARVRDTIRFDFVIDTSFFSQEKKVLVERRPVLFLPRR